MDHLLRRTALAAGHTDEEIRRLYLRCGWRRLGHGAYLPDDAYRELDAVARHRLLIDTTAPTLAPDALIGHQSAAVVYGWPLWQVALDRVHVTRNRRNGGRIKQATKVHCAPVDELVEVDGLSLTTPARTVVDIARTVSFEQAVVTGDAALRECGIDGDELVAELERAKYRRGIAAARRAVEFLHPYSESVGESRSRVMIRREGLPTPLSQVDIHAADGRFLGRVDFYYPDLGVVGEFDGRAKYGALLAPGQDPTEVLFAEKRREDGLRAAGSRWCAGYGTNYPAPNRPVGCGPRCAGPGATRTCSGSRRPCLPRAPCPAAPFLRIRTRIPARIRVRIRNRGAARAGGRGGTWLCAPSRQEGRAQAAVAAASGADQKAASSSSMMSLSRFASTARVAVSSGRTLRAKNCATATLPV